MQWAMGKADERFGADGELLRGQTIQGIGDKRVDADGNIVRVGGADGWGGGVRLANSDPETQRRNMKKLNKFLRHQKILKKDPDREKDPDRASKELE